MTDVTSHSIKGVQVNMEPATKEAEVQCTPIMTEACVQCGDHPLATSSPMRDPPSEPDMSDIEGQSYALDSSAYTFSPGSSSS